MKKLYLAGEEDECDFFQVREDPHFKRCFCRLYQNKQRDNKADPIWDEDKLLLTHFCPVYAQHYRKPVFVRTTPDEIILLTKIQDYLIKKIEGIGVYIESNPTSNTTIGDVDSLFQLPLTNLNSKGLSEEKGNNIMLTINSDNPLVFNTNVENEIANVYHMLINQGYSRENVLAWVDKVRQYGMDSSFIKQVKKPSLQRKQLEEIVAALTGKPFSLA